MFITCIENFFDQRARKLHLIKQEELQKKCIDFYDTIIAYTEPLLEGLRPWFLGSYSVPVLIAKQDSSLSFYLQAYRAYIDDGKVLLYYGEYRTSNKPKWYIPIPKFPHYLWLDLDKYPRPIRPALLLCDYGEHYEVVRYANNTWTTELDFPVKPKKYFVLKYLND